MIEEIKQAAELSNRCQRNWDHDATISGEHLQTILHCIQHAPTKQNETHYKVFYTTDPDLIYRIYGKTKHFAVTPYTGIADFTDNDGRTQLDYNVRNSQVNANLLIAFCDDWDQDKSRSLIHKIVDERSDATPTAHKEKEKQRFFSMGIAAGEVLMAANLLGYRTGLCSAFWPDEMKDFFDGSFLRILVGVGIPHPDKDRREHEETTNKNIVAIDRRNGPDNEKWLFPTFKKEVTIKEL